MLLTTTDFTGCWPHNNDRNRCCSLITKLLPTAFVKENKKHYLIV